MLKEKNLTLIDLIIPGIESKVLVIAKDVFLIFSLAFLTAVSAKLKLEIGPVPVTMQTFVVLLSGALLGARRGALAQITYLLFGLAGFPWFSRGGGIQYIFSPTFGYIIGFVLAAFLVGFFCQRGWDRNLRTAILAILIGNVVLYIPGLLWLAKFVGVEKILAIGFYPFILGDLVKIFLAGSVLPMGWKLIKRSPNLIDN